MKALSLLGYRLTPLQQGVEGTLDDCRMGMEVYTLCWTLAGVVVVVCLSLFFCGAEIGWSDYCLKLLYFARLPFSWLLG